MTLKSVLEVTQVIKTGTIRKLGCGSYSPSIIIIIIIVGFVSTYKDSDYTIDSNYKDSNYGRIFDRS